MIEWILDHLIELGMVCGLLLAGISIAWLNHAHEQRQQERIELCERAFEYTREQCEFIVRQNVIVGR